MSNSEILEQNNQKLAELTETLSQKALSQVPAGGTTDQILAKASDADYDTKWVDAPSGGEKLYQHIILLGVGTNDTTTLTLMVPSKDIFTVATLLEYLKKAVSNSWFPVQGVNTVVDNTGKVTRFDASYQMEIQSNIINGVYTEYLVVHRAGVDFTNFSFVSDSYTVTNIQDTVIEP